MAHRISGTTVGEEVMISYKNTHVTVNTIIIILLSEWFQPILPIEKKRTRLLPEG